MAAAPAAGSGRRAPAAATGGSSALRALAPASLLLLPAEAETRQRLLRTAKKEVKQIMEEAVTRKFVHEDSSHIISFCAAVEGCILHGLKRRAAGFLRSNKIAALFMKVGKSFPPAEELSRKVQGLEQLIESTRNQGSSLQEGPRKAPRPPGLSPQAIKHLWIRTALFEKVLDKIVHYLVENSSKYYEKEALLMDPVDGPILASLLVGPCALEYTKMKTADHFWTDPSADELVQRHRIHSSHGRQDSPTKRPALCIQKRHSSGSMDDRPSLSARDYVESLHQNSRATLLYGKNNVLVQPRDDMEAIPGYLSLHQTAEVMTLKWTPNQLMNGSVGDLDYEKSIYWDYAMTIHLEDIVYLHCHQQAVDSGGTVVLVSQDGIQRPPLRFPKGGHLLQFLSCLENGLLPHGQLDPPLWSQRGKGPAEPSSDREEEEATDYVFRILYPGIQDFAVVNGSCLAPTAATVGASGQETIWMARIPGKVVVTPKWPLSLPGGALPSPTSSESRQHCSAQDLMEAPGSALPSMWQPGTHKASCSSCAQGGPTESGLLNGCNHERAPLKLLCDNMKYQIVSRAFYGWLAYCRHLSTVRTHLSALVNHNIVSPEVPCEASSGLTAEIWGRFLQDSTSYQEKELLRLVYFGGVQPEIRKSVWPFLLGHYQFGMPEAERKEVDLQTRAHYEQTMAEWLGCEAIVRQREKESHAAALAKCSSGASLESQVGSLRHRDSTISDGSSQSSSFGPQNLSQLQSDSSGSTQVFESVEELEQTEAELKLEAGRRAALPKGGLPEAGSCSPNSGHPSSQNFSVASAYSEQSVSNEEGWPEGGKGGAPQTVGEGPSSATESGPLDGKGEAEGPQGGVPAAKSLDAFIGMGKELPGKEGGPLSVADHWALPGAEQQPSSMGSEDDLSEEPEMESLYPTLDSHSLAVTDLTLSEVSPVSSSGVTYSPELLDLYTVNLHRIEKDVQRCDRNYWYFSPGNLEKLRNVMCSYIWHHMDVGYVQGMCDLLAPLLVILDEEALAFSCFTELMKRMNQNFPHGGVMDTHFANMRSLIQILDSELFELMHQNGDYTHFYFCYRWFLLDFKRELVYEDVFTVWETIWAAAEVSSSCYVLFIALALVEVYRDIILENNMDFTDIIKFFNEMAERHNTKQIMQLARELVSKVQTLIENK
ncbi:small G protein signaling modulator 1 isoform X3 [Crotalus tigris]|uniref:small G protein signaling modulator 1 isoform X3 n=1 Tax=Crotalus tigris TaxID=88082 RepID=UPI00192F4B19|nr:small G protein signaling modulator 1 isoform X3 [Crotalus tigris]